MSNLNHRTKRSYTRQLIFLLIANFVLLFYPITALGKPYTGRTISLDLQDTDFDNFLRIIAEVSNLNILSMVDYNEKITLKVMDTPWDEILYTQLEKRNLKGVFRGNVFTIYDGKAKIYPNAFKNQYTGRLISFDTKGPPDLENALRIIAEVSNKNIICSLSSEEIGRPTVRIIDIPWDQALDIYADTNNREIVHLYGNVIKLYHREDAARYRLRGRRYNGKPISIDLMGMKIAHAVKMVEEAAGKKITGKPPKGAITLRLINVPWDQVLDLILDDYRFEAKIGSREIYIYKQPLQLKG